MSLYKSKRLNEFSIEFLVLFVLPVPRKQVMSNRRKEYYWVFIVMRLYGRENPIIILVMAGHTNE